MGHPAVHPPATATAHPADLSTPETPDAATESVGPLSLIRQCARCELSPDARAALLKASERLSPSEWGSVPGLARQHGLAPLVFAHLAQADALPLPPVGVVAELRAAYCEALVTNRRLEIELGRLLAAFKEQHVEALALKGVTLAARYYPTSALRPSSDIDVLVKREQLSACLRALRTLGYAPEEGAGKPLDFDVLYYLELDYRNARGMRVEPHLELARLPAYRAALPVAQVWERAETLTIGGVPVRYLHPWDELWYLSLHYGVPHQAQRLIWLVDIAELVRKHADGASEGVAANWDWEGFVAATIQRGLAMPVGVALQQARDLLDLALPAPVMAQLLAAAATPAEQERWRAAHASPADFDRLRQHLLSLPTIPEKLAFVWGAGIVGARKTCRRLNNALQRQ